MLLSNPPTLLSNSVLLMLAVRMISIFICLDNIIYELMYICISEQCLLQI